MPFVRTITIVLTRFDGLFGDIVCLFSRSTYSHSAIALEDDPNEFYSFNYNGFCIEHPFYRKKRAHLLEIRIPVTEDQYQAVRQEIQHFIAIKDQLTYSRLGVFFLFMRIPVRFRNRYFCSQFIAEILSRSGVVRLQKSPTLYFPNQLIDRLEYVRSPRFVFHAPI